MRKCWNCGQPTNDETSRVCSDEICQRAEKKSINGEFRIKHPREHLYGRSLKHHMLKRGRDEAAKADAKAAAKAAFDAAYAAAYAATFSEDYAIGCAAAAARDAYFAASTEADEDVVAEAKAAKAAKVRSERNRYLDEICWMDAGIAWDQNRPPDNRKARNVKASDSRERMKKAMQDLGMTEELKLYFGEE